MGHARLPLRVEHQRFEPGYSLLVRLAARHGERDVREFIKQVDVSARPFVDGVVMGKMLDTLACLSGAQEGELIRYSPEGHGLSNRTTLDGVLVGEGGTGILRGPLCPSCFREDLDLCRGPDVVRPWRRFWWDILFINTCPFHGVLLERRCRACGIPHHPLRGGRFCSCGHDVTSATTPCSDLAADRLMIDRLLGEPTDLPAFAAEMELPQLAKFMLHIGRNALHGGDTSTIQLADGSLGTAARARLAEAGLELIQDWPAAFYRTLDRMAVAPTSSRSPKQQQYGTYFMHWTSLLGGAVGEVTRAAVLEHARRKCTEGNRLTVLGRRDLGSERINNRLAAELAGRPPQQTRRILLAMGCKLDVDRPTRWVVARSEMLRLPHWLQDHPHHSELLPELGLTAFQLKRLSISGLLVPVRESTGNLSKFYIREAIEVFVSSLRGKAPAFATALPKTVSIKKAASRMGSIAELVRKIMSGDVIVEGYIEAEGRLGGLLVADTGMHIGRKRLRRRRAAGNDMARMSGTDAKRVQGSASPL